MNRRSIGMGLFTALAILSLATINNAQAQSAATAIGGVREQSPISGADIQPPIIAAVTSPDRPAEDRALDAGRQPDQMLAFFGIKPGMKVADLVAVGGYTTELLSRVVGPTGKVYSQNPPPPPELKKATDTWKVRLKKPALKNVVPITSAFNSDAVLPVPPGSLDAVIMNMNYHDLVLFGANRDATNASVMKALKPGGVYGIVDHSAKDGSGIADLKLHRIDEKFLVDEVEKAGFKLAAASSALRHPEDDRTWIVFKKRGETDRFMLKFVKPEK
jgi:predicted methyltransferase